MVSRMDKTVSAADRSRAVSNGQFAERVYLMLMASQLADNVRELALQYGLSGQEVRFAFMDYVQQKVAAAVANDAGGDTLDAAPYWDSVTTLSLDAHSAGAA